MIEFSIHILELLKLSHIVFQQNKNVPHSPTGEDQYRPQPIYAQEIKESSTCRIISTKK